MSAKSSKKVYAKTISQYLSELLIQRTRKNQKVVPMVLKHSSYTGEEVRSDAEGDRGNIILHEFRKN
jgi:hypothetical protein